MNNLLERVGIHMPQYRNVNNLKNGRKIIITPKPYWRNLKVLPYFVGDTIKFRLEALGKNEIDGKFDIYYVTEFFRDREKGYYIIDKSPYDFEGRIVDGEGDIRYSVGLLPSHDTHVVVTAKAINTDRWSLGCVGFLLGIIGTISAGIILGFIQIIPFWRIWIP